MSEKKIAECVECHKSKPILAKGLCALCYSRSRVWKRRESKPKIPGSGRDVKKRATKVGYFETFGSRLDTLVRDIETKGKEIETLQKQHNEMRVQLLKSRHEILQEIDKKAIDKALKIIDNMAEDGQKESKR